MASNGNTIPKVIYLAKRNPALSRDEFPPRWRQHSLLAGSCTSIRGGFARVAQCINVYDREIVPRASLEYDGVNLLSFVSDEASASVWQQDEAHDFLLSDELETFSTYVRYFSLPAQGHVVAEAPMAPFCLIEFVKRDARMDMHAFVERLVDAHGRMAAGSRRAVVNVVTDRMPLYNWDAITETWFASLDDARAFYATPAWKDDYLAARDAISQTGRTLTMWTRINYARPALDEQ